MNVEIRLTLTLKEFAEFTATLYKQGIKFNTHQHGDNEYTFVYTGY